VFSQLDGAAPNISLLAAIEAMAHQGVAPYAPPEGNKPDEPGGVVPAPVKPIPTPTPPPPTPTPHSDSGGGGGPTPPPPPAPPPFKPHDGHADSINENFGPTQADALDATKFGASLAVAHTLGSMERQDLFIGANGMPFQQSRN
jgi:hypothetical protein